MKISKKERVELIESLKEVYHEIRKGMTYETKILITNLAYSDLNSKLCKEYESCLEKQQLRYDKMLNSLLSTINLVEQEEQ